MILIAQEIRSAQIVYSTILEGAKVTEEQYPLAFLYIKHKKEGNLDEENVRPIRGRQKAETEENNYLGSCLKKEFKKYGISDGEYKKQRKNIAGTKARALEKLSLEEFLKILEKQNDPQNKKAI